VKLASAIAVAVTLSACSPTGPTQAQAEAALQDFFATPHTDTVDVVGGEFRGASLTSLGMCSAMGVRYRCQAAFTQKGAVRNARLTIVKRDSGWFVESVRAE
jgi:hypothetical protein